MAKLRIIARFNNGRMLKGHTENFNPNGTAFNLHPFDAENQDGTGVVVAVKNLKAIFIVKEFAGNPNQAKQDQDNPAEEHADQQAAESPKVAAQPTGMAFRVTFNDGEELLGTSMNYDPCATGFFLFPIDPDSNNLRVFVVNESVSFVEQVNLAKAG